MNTATIMDMMFNTEMIVKVMKGGKEDMTENRYRYDTGCIIDQESGEILTTKQAVNRLNRQWTLLKEKNETIKFHVDRYNNVIDTIKESLANERTHIGQNVLKQLLESIE